MHATKAAVEEGIVPGGGVALLRSIKAVEALKEQGDMQVGINIVRRALEEPLRQIADNAGIEGAVVVAKVRETQGRRGGLQRAQREVREPGRGRRHRPDQGRALGAAERGVDRVAAAHHRGSRLRDPRGEGREGRRRGGAPRRRRDVLKPSGRKPRARLRPRPFFRMPYGRARSRSRSRSRGDGRARSRARSRGTDGNGVRVM